MIERMSSRVSGTTRSPGPQRLLMLYARGRSLPLCVALFISVWALAPLLRQWASFDTWGAWGEAEQFKQFVAVQVIPALAAAVIGVSTWSPLGETERTAVSALPRLRAVHLGTMLALGLVLAFVSFAAWESRSIGVPLEWVAVRNLIGYAGLALLAGRVIDARLSWLAPITWCAVAVFGAMVTPIDRLWQEPWWQWSGLAPGHAAGWAISLALAGAGIVSGVIAGSRDVTGEGGEW